MWPLPGERVARRAGHHDLKSAALVVGLVGWPEPVPLRPQLDDALVEVDADAPAHADHHRLGRVAGCLAWRASKCATRSSAIRSRRLSVPTIASRRAHLLFSFSRRCDLFGLGDLLELGVDLRLLGLSRGRSWRARPRSRSARWHRLARRAGCRRCRCSCQRRPGCSVGQFDGRAGEADKGGVGQRIAHVPGEAVDEVVLAAVGLVGDHHDVGTLTEQRMRARRARRAGTSGSW